MSEEQPRGNGDGAEVQFIGVLDSIYSKLDDDEKRFLMELTAKAGAMRQHAGAAQRELDEVKQMLVQTQMFLAVVVKEHGIRSADDGRAIMRLHRDAFGHVKGDLESWDEPNHFVLSYKDEAAKKTGDGEKVPEEGGLATPSPADAERTPN